MYPAALAFIAISRAESHSMTLLEAWTLGVLSFKDKCEVMRYQVERCSGWLHYASQEEFNQTIDIYRRGRKGFCALPLQLITRSGRHYEVWLIE